MSAGLLKHLALSMKLAYASCQISGFSSAHKRLSSTKGPLGAPDFDMLRSASCFIVSSISDMQYVHSGIGRA